MDIAVRYFELAALHVQLSALLNKAQAASVPDDTNAQVIRETLIYCLKDLEAAMASRKFEVPEFSETGLSSARSYKQNRRWFEDSFKLPAGSL